MDKVPLQKRNHEIDSWRGISILMVIIGHLMDWRFQTTFQLTAFHNLHSASVWEVVKNILLRFCSPLPSLGVSFFFVISGYLITTILLREESQYHSISLSAFYVRRAFRILPALFTYLLFIWALAFAGIIKVPWPLFTKALVFLSDTSLSGGNWWLGHTWSLSVEEQFYLLWPLVFRLLNRQHRAVWLAAGYVLLISSSYVPAMSTIWVDHTYTVLGQAFPCIVIGAFFACTPNATQKIDHFATRNRKCIAVGLLVIQPIFASMPVFSLIIRPFIPLLIAFVFFSSLHNRSIFSAMLSARWLSGIGLISYSLYLWQQPFTGSLSFGGSGVLQWTILCIPIAAISYAAIEKPMIRIGHRISSRIIMDRFTRSKLALANSALSGIGSTSVTSSEL